MPFSQKPFEASKDIITSSTCVRTRLVCLSETLKMRETTNLGSAVTFSAELLQIKVLECEAKHYVKKITLMFDLKKSDMILVFKPRASDESSSYAEAFAVVRVLRQYGHQNCFVLPETVLYEFHPDTSELFSPFEEKDFDYELNEDKLVSFEEIHSMVKRGET